MTADVRIRAAGPADWAAVSALLTAAKLAPLDETAQFGPQYAVAEDLHGNLVGVAGYERYGSDILLRSVAVAESHRSAGLGARLTADRLAHARAAGSSAAFLLTDTAARYWQRHGFETIDRSSAPAPIAQSSEWAHACPASAVAMKRVLANS
jgi:amino-acid N-acetyltransferase